MNNNTKPLIVVDTFFDFLTANAQFVGDRPSSWRVGQASFNFLVRIRPDLAEMIRGSDFDPFFDGDHLPDFFDFLARHWDDDKTF